MDVEASTLSRVRACLARRLAGDGCIGCIILNSTLERPLALHGACMAARARHLRRTDTESGPPARDGVAGAGWSAGYSRRLRKGALPRWYSSFFSGGGDDGIARAAVDDHAAV